MRRICLPACGSRVVLVLLLALTTPGGANAQQRSVRGWTDGPYQAKGTGGSQALLFDWRFLDVYCIDMPRLHPAEDVVYGTLGGGAISYYRLRYQDGPSAFVVTSTVPKDRTPSDEYNLQLRREQDNARSIGAATSPDRYRVDTGTSAFGPTVRVRLLNIGLDDPDEPFPVARPLLNVPDEPLYSLSVHRLFVHGGNRYEIAVLAVPAEGESRAALEARADRLADSMVTSLQTCTARLETSKPEADKPASPAH